MIPSFSSRTIVYKGMLTGAAAARLLPGPARPADEDRARARPLALLDEHVPELGARAPVPDDRPQRRDQHAARQRQLDARARVAARLASSSATTSQKVLPVVRPGGSDSATFDNVLELLVLAGRSLPHAMMMMIPEAYEGRDDLPDELRGFYDFHSLPDGAVGRPGGGRLHRRPRDRRDARPQRPAPRPLAGDEGRLGRARLRDRRARRCRRRTSCARAACSPGKLFLVDLERGRIVDDDEVKREIAARSRTASGSSEGVVHLADLPERAAARAARRAAARAPARVRLHAGGPARAPRADWRANAEEPIGSMGNDLALAVLSDREPLLFAYFKQLFAQVTNPPIDSIREDVVMSVGTSVGSERNLLDETPEHAHQLVMQTSRSCATRELEKLRQVDSLDLRGAHARHHVAGRRGPRRAWRRRSSASAREADEALADGVNILILSDRALGAERVADPVAARRRRRAPPPRARGHAPADRARARVRRAARGPPLRDADRLRRRARSTRT